MSDNDEDGRTEIPVKVKADGIVEFTGFWAEEKNRRRVRVAFWLLIGSILGLEIGIYLGNQVLGIGTGAVLGLLVAAAMDERWYRE